VTTPTSVCWRSITEETTTGGTMPKEISLPAPMAAA
jgi:hypothetical protein